MEKNLQCENDRAYRIVIRMNDQHLSLTKIYENLVDRDFTHAERDVKTVITNMKLILKSMEDDDF